MFKDPWQVFLEELRANKTEKELFDFYMGTWQPPTAESIQQPKLDAKNERKSMQEKEMVEVVVVPGTSK